MSDDRPLADQIVDLLLAGPAGLVLDAREGFPGFAPKPIEQIEAQVRTAKLIGQFALRAGLRRLGQSGDLAARMVPDAAGSDTAEPAIVHDDIDVQTDPAPRARRAVKRQPSSARVGEAIAVRVLDDLADVVGTDVVGTDVVGVDVLAIVAYDELAASQVVVRLEALSSAELDAVRRYEEAHRRRRTILAKVAQLQARA